jgi:hypothetical protein
MDLQIAKCTRRLNFQIERALRWNYLTASWPTARYAPHDRFGAYAFVHLCICAIHIGWVRACVSVYHRYLINRLSLQVVYLWRHVSSTASPFILWWSNLEILVGPLHRSSPFIGELRCQAIQMEHGPYISERTQKAVYIVVCLWCICSAVMLELYGQAELTNSLHSPLCRRKEEDPVWG